MNNSAIGVFDSGVGGLTCVDELRKLMPNEDIIYLGDTAPKASTPYIHMQSRISPFWSSMMLR